MKVNTTRFGVLDVDESSKVKMLKGPIGLEEMTDYCLIQHRPDTNFKWLQSTEEPSLAFVVIDPSEFVDNYDIEISDADAESLHLTKEEDAIVLSIVTVGADGSDVTANLAAPIIINSKELTGMQIILQNERYSVRHTLMTQEQKQSTKKVVSKAA